LTALLKISLTVIACLLAVVVPAQLTVTGTVYDSTRSIPVKDVLVKSTAGIITRTDSNGRYSIVASDADSLTFIYNEKPTARFSVRQIPDIAHFDIALHIRVTEKFRTLKEVKVYSRTYRQDSIENRLRNAKYFNYEKPGIALSNNSYSGVTGLDLGEFINIFRFRRNKMMKKTQERLMAQEQENYINYRFNKATVRRITRLTGTQLDEFMRLYRPDFAFTSESNTVEFYQYILNASYHYRQQLLIQQRSTDSLQRKNWLPASP